MTPTPDPGDPVSDSILFSLDDSGLARITLNRPASLNAMDFEMAERWREVARAATSKGVGAVILDAAGPAFCAGGDVVAMATSGSSGSDVTETARIIHEGIRTLVGAPVPIVAAVQGAVAGGGLGLMLAADYIVASEGARFVSKYANIGLTPDLGVSTLLPAAIGERRALQLLLQDRALTAAEALEWGLIAEVAAPDALAGRAEQIARFWLEGATGAFGQAVRLVRTGAGRSFDDNLDDEAATIGAAFDTPAATARITAFAAGSSRHAKRGDA
jgi:2-(1,2-epoxy-1,2-dihydrophenyl)acetyl-CoA isomerase